MMRALIALAFAAVVAGCQHAPPRVITTPSVCPAPRTPPATAIAAARALPDELPTLPPDLNPDAAAVSILVNRTQSADLYHRARRAALDMAGWFKSQE